MIRCLIVDDEQHAIDVLQHYVEQCDLLRLIHTTTNAVEAMNVINSGKVDLLFQDIHMSEISGLEIVRAIGDKCNVILTTAYKDYAVDGYELGVIDYLLKPISYPRFIAAVQKVAEKIQQTDAQAKKKFSNDFMYVKTGQKHSVIKINFDDIEYIESLKNYVAIYHGGEKTIAYLSMKELEETLPDNLFIRVHKSFILSFKKMARIEGNEVVLSRADIKITIGDSYKTKFWDIIKRMTLG